MKSERCVEQVFAQSVGGEQARKTGGELGIGGRDFGQPSGAPPAGRRLEFGELVEELGESPPGLRGVRAHDAARNWS